MQGDGDAVGEIFQDLITNHCRSAGAQTWGQRALGAPGSGLGGRSGATEGGKGTSLGHSPCGSQGPGSASEEKVKRESGTGHGGAELVCL